MNKNRVVSFVIQPMTLYHGTNRSDFTEFDMAHVEPFNVGLHFDTRAAAESRIVTCALTLENPLCVDDIFGYSYVGIFDMFEYECLQEAVSTC